MSKGVMFSTILRDCEANIGGVPLLLDLIPLAMTHFDVIIGMDWLSKFGAKIDCTTKTITFEEPKGGETKLEGDKVVVPPCFISVSKARQLLKKGCQ